ncbi:MAG: SDR family oxidoreductase [Candidatus Kariarchaeaceae archaeon]|jgi:NAD(P)-dependent dehydrogenase (short-subunit alcohol dehydrogenase family)
MIETQANTLDYWKGKRVLITGGTQGLGKALTEHLHQLGAQVVIVARGTDALEKFRESFPDNLYTIQADIGEKEAIHKISARTIAMLEGIDVVINNASSLGPVPLRTLASLQCEEFEEVLQVNLLGPFRLIKALLPYMKLNNGGLIVNISSDAAVNAYPTWGPYSVSKAALDHLTAIWQEELRDDNITFLSVDPGDMHTQMHLDAIPDANTDELYQPIDVARELTEFLSQQLDTVRYTASEWRERL